MQTKVSDEFYVITLGKIRSALNQRPAAKHSKLFAEYEDALHWKAAKLKNLILV